MKFFLDANVIFTAAYSPNGKSNFIIKNAGVLKIKLISSDYALEEASRNLQKKKSKALDELKVLSPKIQIFPSVFGPSPINLPPKDQTIFLTALKNKATHLLTGDIKDFGPFMNNSDNSFGIIIQTVNDFLKNFGI